MGRNARSSEDIPGAPAGSPYRYRYQLFPADVSSRKRQGRQFRIRQREKYVVGAKVKR